MNEYIVGFLSNAEEIVSEVFDPYDCQVNPFRKWWRGQAANPDDAKEKAIAAGLRWER